MAKQDLHGPRHERIVGRRREDEPGDPRPRPQDPLNRFQRLLGRRKQHQAKTAHGRVERLSRCREVLGRAFEGLDIAERAPIPRSCTCFSIVGDM